MNRTLNRITNLNEGYQPVITISKNISPRTGRPKPPQGGSGVPNIQLNHASELKQNATITQNNR